MFQILGYKYQYICHSPVACFYWFCICDIFPMQLSISPFFVFIMSIISVTVPYVYPSKQLRVLKYKFWIVKPFVWVAHEMVVNTWIESRKTKTGRYNTTQCPHFHSSFPGDSKVLEVAQYVSLQLLCIK
jgi:hypothetical protein